MATVRWWWQWRTWWKMSCSTCCKFLVPSHIVWTKGLVSEMQTFEMFSWLPIATVPRETLWRFFLIRDHMMARMWIQCSVSWINISQKTCPVVANTSSGNLSGVFSKCKKCYSVVKSRSSPLFGVTWNFFFGDRVRHHGRAGLKGRVVSSLNSPCGSRRNEQAWCTGSLESKKGSTLWWSFTEWSSCWSLVLSVCLSVSELTWLFKHPSSPKRSNVNLNTFTKFMVFGIFLLFFFFFLAKMKNKIYPPLSNIAEFKKRQGLSCLEAS